MTAHAPSLLDDRPTPLPQASLVKYSVLRHANLCKEPANPGGVLLLKWVHTERMKCCSSGILRKINFSQPFRKATSHILDFLELHQGVLRNSVLS